MIQIIRADARALPLEDESIDCCVTSPPYFGLRDYGVEGQIGGEASPDAFVAELVAVFREVRRVLKPSGSLWLNLGDSYAAQRGGTAMPAQTVAGGEGGKGDEAAHRGMGDGYRAHRNASAFGLKHKDLIGIPWRVAFALQADGWWLRSDIIWHKPNPMPESVTDRPTKAHEYMFLLTKSDRYFYDHEAVKEPSVGSWNSAVGFGGDAKKSAGQPLLRTQGAGSHHDDTEKTGRNRRTVWTIPTKPFAGAHFATMPEALVEPCILAGCPEGGTVLDPFAGSGTVGRVAIRHRRKAILSDLNTDYIEIAKGRTSDVQIELAGVA